MATAPGAPGVVLVDGLGCVARPSARWISARSRSASACAGSSGRMVSSSVERTEHVTGRELRPCTGKRDFGLTQHWQRLLYRHRCHSVACRRALERSANVGELEQDECGPCSHGHGDDARDGHRVEAPGRSCRHATPALRPPQADVASRAGSSTAGRVRGSGGDRGARGTKGRSQVRRPRTRPRSAGIVRRLSHRDRTPPRP